MSAPTQRLLAHKLESAPAPGVRNRDGRFRFRTAGHVTGSCGSSSASDAIVSSSRWPDCAVVTPPGGGGGRFIQMDVSRYILRSTPARLFAGTLALAATGALGAQEPLRVLQHLPQSQARPNDVITITFDRPVSGLLERSVDPARFVRVEPDVQARIEWRDPSTIRIIPGAPLEPAHRYVVTVDTGFEAFDGSRLRTPERFTLDVRGPAMVASEPRLNAVYATAFDPTGKLTLVFSAPVTDSLLERVVRLEVRAGDACAAARTIGYRVVRQRSPRESDPYDFQHWYGGGADPGN